MFIRINPDKINSKEIDAVVKCLKDGGIIIYPTDSVYAIGCDLNNSKGIERICALKGIKPEKSNFTFVCSDLSHLSDFTKPIPNPVFKMMRKALPGPYTFILEANNKVPKLMKQNKKTVGIRVPDNTICKEIVLQLGHPILSSSLHDTEDDLLDYFTDPSVIYERYKEKVDLVIDGGFGNIYPTTVIDVSTDEPLVLRQGLGETETLF